VAALLTAVAALPLPTVPDAAEAGEPATDTAWHALAALAGPVAAAAAAAQPPPAWAGAGDGERRQAFAPAAAAAFLGWLARAVQALPAPSTAPALEAAGALGDGARDLAAALGPGTSDGKLGRAVEKVEKRARGGPKAPPALAGPFGDWRACFGLPAGA
jgi:hypothetical protein